MPATEDRMRELAPIRLDHGGRATFDMGLDQSGVSSADAVAFVRSVGRE